MPKRVPRSLSPKSGVFKMPKDAAAAEDVPSRRSLRQKGVKATPAAHLANLIRESSYCVFVTGAGLSTNAQIRDYRGPNGIWTEAAKAGAKEGAAGIWDDDLYRTVPAASPTLAHRGVNALLASGATAYVISQNEDGLHLRSGADREKLSELHGNDFIEVGVGPSPLPSLISPVSHPPPPLNMSSQICRDCKAEVVRDFVTYYKDTYRATNPLGQHVTGRACPSCGGALLDTCVDFGEVGR